jgi:hypothetical protein
VEPWLAAASDLLGLPSPRSGGGLDPTAALARLLAGGGWRRVADLAVAPTPAAVLRSRSSGGLDPLCGPGLTLESQVGRVRTRRAHAP